jgi:hypothetical protein
LLGTTNLLNSISSFAADGGLREAASWASLRQQIYISLTTQQPLAINLTTYRNSSAFNKSDDESTANKIIFIFASILTATFQPESHLSAAQWNDLDAEVHGWNLSKPWDFAPLWVDDSVDTSQDLQACARPWPELLMSRPAQGKNPAAAQPRLQSSRVSDVHYSSWNAILLPVQNPSFCL